MTPYPKKINNWFWYVLAVIVTGLLILLVIRLKSDNSSNNGSCNKVSRVLEHTEDKKILNVQARRMWGWLMEEDQNVGYCGECAVQSAMLYYGNYVSQEQIFKAGKGPFLLGVNHVSTFKTFHMDIDYVFSVFNVSIWKIFDYIKKQIDDNCPMVMGLYVNESDGDPAYDHIVPIIGYQTGSDGKINDVYFNDAYQMFYSNLDCALDKKGVPKCFRKREQVAVANDAAPFANAIPDVIKKNNPTEVNSIVTLKGNTDLNNELFPVLLVMNNREEPDWGIEDDINMAPTPMSAVAEISGLKAGQKYSLLRFDNPLDLPDKDFLSSGKFTIKVDFIPTCDTYFVNIGHNQNYPFTSDGTYFFRCVKNTNLTVSIYKPGTDRTDHTKGVFPTPSDVAAIVATGKATNFFRDRVNGYQRKMMDLPRHVSKKIKQRLPMKNIIHQNNVGKDKVVIKCGQSDDGRIHTNWKWTFPGYIAQNQQNHGVSITYDVKFSVDDYNVASLPVCLLFDVSMKNSKTGDPIEKGQIQGTIGLDNRLYIIDFTNYFISSYSVDGPRNDGSYVMISQDGATKSVIRPDFS